MDARASMDDSWSMNTRRLVLAAIALVGCAAMPGNEPPDPLLVYVAEILLVARKGLDSRTGKGCPSADAAREALQAVDVALAALGRRGEAGG